MSSKAPDPQKTKATRPPHHSNNSHKKNSVGEQACKKALEGIFQRPFLSNIRPDFLSNPVGGHNLELDVYNSELNLACEYNGKQHYEFVPFFHPSRKDFELQQYRDEFKRRLCKEVRLDLIEVPYTVPPNDIEEYIRDELDELETRKEKESRRRKNNRKRRKKRKIQQSLLSMDL